jgi:4-hydroxy-tetrahydrodipicolinate reductase
MNIALIGYGKMGKAIEAIALERNHTIGLIIDSKNVNQFTETNVANCDVAIEFTHPEIAYANVTRCLHYKIPTISGSTGWNAQLAAAEAICLQMDTALLVASNFSVGVNIFFALNKKLAQLMQHRADYKVQVQEIHHTQKKDAPSGTAITLAEQIMDLQGSKKKWVLGAANNDAELSIHSIREDPAPGTHTISYHSPIDSIEIKHTAHNRTGFALGAVLAAEYIYNKKGVFTMQDVLQMS